MCVTPTQRPVSGLGCVWLCTINTLRNVSTINVDWVLRSIHRDQKIPIDFPRQKIHHSTPQDREMPKRKPSTAPANDDPPHLQPGSQVEISSNDPGFRGSWYTGVIIKRPSSKKPNKFLVQYTHLFEDEAGTAHLKETIDAVDIRPLAPRESTRKFKFSEEVDAYYNDGWWEGVITKELENGKFHVYFKRSKEQLEFGEEQLRLHREWINGSWTPPLEGDELVKEVKFFWVFLVSYYFIFLS